MPRNAMMILLIVALGDIMILGFPNDVNQDIWIAILFATVCALPLALLYGRLVKLMPGMDLYDMAEVVYGRVGGVILSVLFALYCTHLAALILGNYVEFIRLTSLFHTPFVVITLAIFFAGLYLANSGIETLGKWCGIMMLLAGGILLFYSFFSVGQMNLSHLQPVMEHSFADIGKVSLKTVVLPFGEMVVFLGLAGTLKRDAKPCRLFCATFVLLGVILALIALRTILVLGVGFHRTVYFPAYKAASLLRAGHILERIESLLALFYILAGISKMATCVIGAARGATKIFRLPTYRAMIVPVGLLAASLAPSLFHGIERMFDSIIPYRFYALLFQLIIPLAIWLPAEIRAKKNPLPLAAG